MKSLIKTFLLALFIMGTGYGSAQSYQLSSHILDVSTGTPASGVKISLSKKNLKGNWVIIDEKITDENGRIKDFLKQNPNVQHQGIYKLTYETEPYFQKKGVKSFYPFIEVVFEIVDGSHYHVPITLSAYGYSTYRGN